MSEVSIVLLEKALIQVGTVFQRDFVTFEDELPAEVSVTSAGASERATSVTDVKHETTDDN